MAYPQDDRGVRCEPVGRRSVAAVNGRGVQENSSLSLRERQIRIIDDAHSSTNVFSADALILLCALSRVAACECARALSSTRSISV